MAIDTIDCKGYKIKIYHDEIPSNPWEDWDCEPPIIANLDNRTEGFVDSVQNILDSIDIDRKMLSKSLRDTAIILGYDSILDMARDAVWHYGDVISGINGLLDQAILNGDMEALELKCNLGNIPYFSTSSCGYSQGDYAELVAIGTPDWMNKVGVSSVDVERALKFAVNLWSAWAWGDVYGYVIENNDGEEIASCYGYYGDPEESGLLDDAKAEIDSIANQS